jgi:NAD(P)H-nitrite reductase large subunit
LEGTVIVCHCKVVSHRDIEAAVEHGARTVSEVSDICGAGTDCGGCLPVVADTVSHRTGEPAEVACGTPARAVASV